MKIDLVGPKRRGMAMGLNEFAGYGAVSLAAFASGHIASIYGLRPTPFYLGVVFAIGGLLISATLVRDTTQRAREETRVHRKDGRQVPTFKETFVQTSYRNPTLFSVSQAGLVNNLNDGMTWGLFPLFFAAYGLRVDQIGVLAATYPAFRPLGSEVVDRMRHVDPGYRYFSNRFGSVVHACAVRQFLVVDHWSYIVGCGDSTCLSDATGGDW
jgi:MFS family permease